MIGWLIFIINVAIGITFFPYVNHKIKKMVGCGSDVCSNGKDDECSICWLAVFVACFAIITIPVMLFWDKILKPALATFGKWQEKRIDEYNKKIK